jgi:hypothetical protein
LRREQIHKIACNHLITVDMKLEPMFGCESAVTWFAMDHADDEPKMEKLAAKFKHIETKNDFKAKFEECQKLLASGADAAETEDNKPVGGGGDSTPSSSGRGGLFGATATTSTAAASGGLFGTPATTSSAAASGGLFGSQATTSSAAASGGLFGTPIMTSTAAASSGIFGTPATTSTAAASGGIFGAPATTSTAAASGGLFGAPATTSTAAASGGIFRAPATTSTAAASGGIFGAPATASTGTANGEGSILGNAPSASGLNSIFGGSTTSDVKSEGFSFGKSTPNSSLSVSGPGASLFGGAGTSPAKKEDHNDDDGTAVEDGHDPQFEPVIPLPALVTVTTGEEDEEILFQHRSKVFRYASNTAHPIEKMISVLSIFFQIRH